MERRNKYRIRIKGDLNERWRDRLGRMSVVSRKEGGNGMVTILEGELRDQSELSGVLTTLYDLHLDIISVDSLPEE